ncbi:MAG: sigma-70 family RNA polymerase sigma factor [Myxococcota bacterium]
MREHREKPPIEELYRRVFPLIQGKCARMLGDGSAAEDIAQETFLRLSRSQSQFDSTRLMIAWMYKTATRLAIDELRAARRSKADGAFDLQALVAFDPDPEALAATRSLLRRVAPRLSRREIEIAVLLGIDGLKQAEVAELLRVSDRTVRRALVRIESIGRKLQAEETQG